jgi:hypothetical protein
MVDSVWRGSRLSAGCPLGGHVYGAGNQRAPPAGRRLAGATSWQEANPDWDISLGALATGSGAVWALGVALFVSGCRLGTWLAVLRAYLLCYAVGRQ